MSKLRWRRNDEGGLTLEGWRDPFERPLRNGSVWRIQGRWSPIADVFKAKRGERYVVRVLTDRLKDWHPVYDQYTAFTLREAMRLAKFIVGVRDGS